MSKDPRSIDALVAENVERVSRGFVLSIKSRMKDLNVNKIKLAHLIDVHPSFITRILSGKQNMSIETMVKVSSALNCKCDIALSPR